MNHEEDDAPEPCVMCGEPSTEYYDDREDCPYCGGFLCGYKIQQGLDYIEEVGHR